MRDLKLVASFNRLDSLEARLCLPCNHLGRIPTARLYFRAVSRLGDGAVWYALLAALPAAYGAAAIASTVQMAVTALLGVVLYKLLKRVLLRERPFASQPGVEAISAPLDRYSFPSGHTLHATCFLVLLAHHYPPVALLLLPFGLSVAASRVILGLHYPTDVLAGALLGWGLASAALALGPLFGLP